VCEIGHKEIVELLISKGANNWNEGLDGACFGGNKEIVELLISKGANNWNEALCSACEGRNKEIAILMITKGATKSWQTNYKEPLDYIKDKFGYCLPH